MAKNPGFKDQYKEEVRFPLLLLRLLMRDKVILEPYKYLAEIPGKEVRGMLVSSFNNWLQVPADKLNKIKELIQMLHNSSLLYVYIFYGDPTNCLQY